MRRVTSEIMVVMMCMLLLSAGTVALAVDGHDEDEHGDEHSDVVVLTPAEIEEFAIRLAVAGPDTIRMIRKLPAEVQVNANRLAHIAPRYAGIATEVRVDVGDEVVEDQVLAIIESDGSLAPYEMTAFFAGTIIEKHMTRGEPVSRDRDGFVIADLSTVWVDITVYQRDLDQVKVGKSVSLRASAGAAPISGTISYVTPLVDQHTRTATARMVVENSNGQWRPGMFVMADVLTASVVAAVVVPATAVHTMDEHDVIFVQTSAGFAAHEVVVGQRGQGNLEIISGLHAGEKYVADGGFTLKAEMGKDSFGDGHAH